MSEIARTAGVTKPILYEHFGDKSGLAEALSDRFLGELGDSLEAILTLDADPRTAISDGIAMFAAFAEREPELYRFLVEGSPGGSRESFDSPMLEGLADVVARFLVGSSPNQSAAARSELWAVSVLGTVFSGVGWWLQRGGRSRDDLVADLTDLVWGGISGAA